MNESTTVTPLPAYVELAPASAQPEAATAGALLRSYLAILAFHFERPGMSRSTSNVDAALSNLPGLLLQATTQTKQSVSVTSSNVATGLAEILSKEWGTGSDSPELLTLARPVTVQLAPTHPPAGGTSLEVTLIVLERPAHGIPTLGRRTLLLHLQPDDTAPTQPGWTAAKGSKAPVSLTLAVSFSGTTYTVVDSALASSQSFVRDLSRQGLLADLGSTPGYVAIPIN